MITPELISRINELARKQRSVGLTPEEQAEQQALRQTYLAAIRRELASQLEALGARKKACPCCGDRHVH